MRFLIFFIVPIIVQATPGFDQFLNQVASENALYHPPYSYPAYAERPQVQRAIFNSAPATVPVAQLRTRHMSHISSERAMGFAPQRRSSVLERTVSNHRESPSALDTPYDDSSSAEEGTPPTVLSSLRHSRQRARSSCKMERSSTLNQVPGNSTFNNTHAYESDDPDEVYEHPRVLPNTQIAINRHRDGDCYHDKVDCPSRVSSTKATRATITPNLKLMSFSVKINENGVDKRYDYYHFVGKGTVSSHRAFPKKYKIGWRLKSNKDEQQDTASFPSSIALEKATPISENGATEVTATYGLRLTPSANPLAKVADFGSELSYEEQRTRSVKDMEIIFQSSRDFAAAWIYRFTTHRARQARGLSYHQEWVWRIDNDRALKEGYYTPNKDGTYSLAVERTFEVTWRKAFIKIWRFLNPYTWFKQLGTDCFSVAVPQTVLEDYIVEFTENERKVSVAPER